MFTKKKKYIPHFKKSAASKQELFFGKIVSQPNMYFKFVNQQKNTEMLNQAQVY